MTYFALFTRPLVPTNAPRLERALDPTGLLLGPAEDEGGGAPSPVPQPDTSAAKALAMSQRKRTRPLPERLGAIDSSRMLAYLPREGHGEQPGCLLLNIPGSVYPRGRSWP
jgi:hypothetical protein